MNMFWRCCWAVSIEVNIFHSRMNSGRLGGRDGRRGGMDIGRKRRGQASFMVTYSQVITTAGNFPDGGRGCNRVLSGVYSAFYLPLLSEVIS